MHLIFSTVLVAKRLELLCELVPIETASGGKFAARVDDRNRMALGQADDMIDTASHSCGLAALRTTTRRASFSAAAAKSYGVGGRTRIGRVDQKSNDRDVSMTTSR